MEKNPPIVDKKRTYKLRGISYMSLSLSYIALILLLTIILLISVAYFINAKAYIKLILCSIILLGAIFFVYATGIKYGKYGLEILLGKVLQKKHIKNDFPIILKRISPEIRNIDKSIKEDSKEELFFAKSSLLPKNLLSDFSKK